MFSLKSMLFTATAALAGVAMAAPAANGDGALVARDTGLVARQDVQFGDFPAVLNHVIYQCDAITRELNAAISNAPKQLLGKVEISVLKPFILKLVAVIKVAIDQIKLIANLDLKILLGGLTVEACAKLVVDVIVAISGVLKICLNAVVLLQVTALLTLILDVSAAIVVLLDLLIKICLSINLKGFIVDYLTKHGHIIKLIKDAGLTNVLLSLGLGGLLGGLL